MLMVSAQAFESLIPPQTREQAEVLALNLKNLVMYRAASETDAKRCAEAAAPNLANPTGVTVTQRRDPIAAIFKLSLPNPPRRRRRPRNRNARFAIRTRLSHADECPRTHGHLVRESPETLVLDGAGGSKASFTNNCLLARRLMERGVRFVQVFMGG